MKMNTRYVEGQEIELGLLSCQIFPKCTTNFLTISYIEGGWVLKGDAFFSHESAGQSRNITASGRLNSSKPQRAGKTYVDATRPGMAM